MISIITALYNIYTSNVPKGSRHNKIYIYADDTVKPATLKNTDQVTKYLQERINEMEKWTKK